jgi:molybdopterin-synthase adenylyltransferase
MEARYARQKALGFIGKAGQRRLASGSVAIVGCGGLGSVAAELLARAGVGRLLLIDHDAVELSNLQRQALYTERDVFKQKASALKSHLRAINGLVRLSARRAKLGPGNIRRLLSGADVVLDCTDNMGARLVINDFCVRKRVPWVHASAAGAAGFILTMVPGSPCFRCVFPKAKRGLSCREVGMLGPAAHVMASLQVVEAIKLLLGMRPEQHLVRMDVLSYEVRRIAVRKNPSCTACGRKVPK